MARFSQFSSNEKNNARVTESDLKEKFDSYKDLSSGQLHQTLFEEVAKQKASGNFDYQALANMVESMRALLPQQDYEKVKKLLESLK